MNMYYSILLTKFADIPPTSEALPRCYSKQAFLIILQYSQENTCIAVSF